MSHGRSSAARSRVRRNVVPSRQTSTCVVRRLAAFLAALVGAAFAVETRAQPADPPSSGSTVDFATLVKRGDKARSAHDLPKAMEAYRKALELRNDPLVAGRLGLVLFEWRQYDVAAQHLHHAVERPSPDISASEYTRFSNAYLAAQRETCRVDVVIDRRGTVHESGHSIVRLSFVCVRPDRRHVFSHAGRHSSRQPVQCFARPTTSFAGPADWDGSCTTSNAVAANLECPQGSGVPCAQSIMTSPLPAPVQGCEPIPLPVPKATRDTPWWSNVVLSCSATATPEGCAQPASEQCLPPLPPDEPGWRYCVRSDSIRECVLSSVFTQQFLTYPYDGFVDTRSCTECSCAASGGACTGTLRVYQDDACSTNELVSLMVSSDWPNCSNLAVLGDPLSSKEITDLAYEPGTCAPKAGEPSGTVEPINDDEHVVTVLHAPDAPGRSIECVAALGPKIRSRPIAKRNR